MSVTHQTPWMCGCACNTFLKVFLYCKVWDGGVGSTWMFVWWKHDYACTAFFELSKFSYYLMFFPSFQRCTITATRVCMCMTLCSLPTNKTIEHVVVLGGRLHSSCLDFKSTSVSCWAWKEWLTTEVLFSRVCFLHLTSPFHQHEHEIKCAQSFYKKP